jgi:hypothetical protein
MPELTNLLRQRLAGTENGAPVHPDADTITAYVEQSLPMAERQTMAAHLAVCEPCREVVALSLPQLPESAMQTVIKPAPVSAWRRLFTPAFGLAASVTAMAIIAVLVLQLPHRAGPLPTQQNQQAQSTVPAEQGTVADGAVADNKDAATQAPETKPGSKTTAESTNTLDRAQLAQIETQSRQKRDESARMQIAAGFTEPAAPLKAPILTAGLLKKDYVNTNFFANSDDNVVLEGQSNAGRSGNISAAPQPQAAAANRSFSYTSDRLTKFSDIPANAAGKSTVHLLTPTPSPERFTCTLCKVAQATAHTLRLRTVTPALHASALGNSALGGPGMFSNTLEKNQSTEVSAALDKDEGGSLANSGVLSHGALGISSYKSSADSGPTEWRVAGGKLIKYGQSQWEDAYPAAGIEFASVNARGKDVWAGGSHAFLLHSHDAGVTWEVVKLGDTANGTIVGIIAGAFNVQVKTSENQLWLSADGGKTWTLSSE